METTTLQEKIIHLTFDCYEFFKYIWAVDTYCNEIKIIFEKDVLTMTFFDDARIVLCKCIKQLDETVTTDKLEFSFDASAFMQLVKTRKTDNKELELIFNGITKKVEIIKTSEKYHSTVKKVLNELENKIEDLDLSRLYEIEYPSKVSFLIKYLDDFFYESKICSETVTIDVNKDGINFSEVGVIATSEYIIEAQYCNILKGLAKGTYSLELLTALKPLLPILDVTKYITFEVKPDYPIHVQLEIEALDMTMDIFLAPRCDRDDDDDDEDEDEDYEF